MRTHLLVLLALALAAGAQAQRVNGVSVGANPPAVALPAPPRTAAQSSPAPAASTTQASRAGGSGTSASIDATDTTYLLGPADVIEVSVLGRNEYTTRGRISEDGAFQLQYLGQITASNKTAKQLGDEIAAALEKGGYFAHPVVRVDVVSYASRYVTVLGNVTTPGLVPVDRAYRLSEIVARVGGVKETGADFVILRPLRGAERRIPIATLATGDISDDPFVSPGDKIYSPQAELFYVSGQVKLPGAFPVVPGATVRMAISRAGGVNDAGTDKRVTIRRKGAKLAHVDLDAAVEPGDVIVVGERLF